MVRFIIKVYNIKKRGRRKFTFQYGQIYYYYTMFEEDEKLEIYIPIWLDLL